MGDCIEQTADMHLSNCCELTGAPAFPTSHDDSTLCFLKSISSISTMSDILVDSQLSHQYSVPMPRFSGGFPQESISKMDQKCPDETCLFTNQNFRTRTVSAQTIHLSMESWNDSLESVNPEGQHPKIPVWIKQTLTSYAGSSRSLDQMAFTEEVANPAALSIFEKCSGLAKSSQHRVEFLAQELKRRRYLHQLKELVLFWRGAAISHSKATKFFYIRLMARVFISMRNFAREAIRRRKLLAIAVQHSRRRVCRLALQAWVRKIRLQRAVCVKFRIALLHHKNGLTRTVLHRWRTYSNLMAKRRMAGENLARTNELQLLRHIWKAWSKFISHQRALREACTRLTVVREQLLKLETFKHWRRRSRQLPRARLIAFKFEQSQKTALLRQVFSDWQHMIEEARAQRFERQMILDDASRRIAAKLKAVYFRFWRQCLDAHKKYEIAAKASERRILSKTFDCWKMWTAELIHQGYLQKQAKCFLETRIKISYLTRWIDAQRELRRIRVLERIALSHWALTIEARVWVAWRLFLKNREVEQARRRAANQRYLSRLSKQALALWLTSAFNIQKERLSQAKILTSNQNFLAMKFCQIWIGALPLKRKCGTYSLDIQGSRSHFNEQDGSGEHYDPTEKDYFLTSFNIDLNYHGLQPRIPQCILSTCKNRMISGISTLPAEIYGLESVRSVPTEPRLFPSTGRDQGTHAILSVEKVRLGMRSGSLTEGLFSLSDFYEISSSLLTDLHNASRVQRRKRKLKCQLLALEVAEGTERDPMLKQQILEEIFHINADIQMLQKDLLSMSRNLNDSLCKLSKILF
uniref:Sfi1 spindle body domain-containing protein n=1 Tax=Schistocephalus solidus TaxID=70667 RepID=A0A0V0J683_SCHSO